MDGGGKQVPLPAGNWVLAGRSFEQIPELDSDAYGAIESLVLFQVEDQTVTAFVIIGRNLVPIEEGWGTASECIGEKEMAVVVNYDASQAHTFCGFVGPITTSLGEGIAGSWKAAAAYAKDKGITVPIHWLEAGFRLSNAHDVGDGRDDFAAALAERADGTAAGAEPAESSFGWSMSLLPAWLGGEGDKDEEADPRAIQHLTDWLGRMRGLVRLGFANGLSGQAPLAMPFTSAAASPDPTTALKLQ